VRDGILRATGTPYRLSDAVQAHADLEAGRSSGSLYLVP
jgi:NADPH:quinone reductase